MVKWPMKDKNWKYIFVYTDNLNTRIQAYTATFPPQTLLCVTFCFNSMSAKYYFYFLTFTATFFFLVKFHAATFDPSLQRTITK